MARRKTEKIMTPKKGVRLGRNNRQYKHGDKIPPAMLEFFDKKHLEEWKPPEESPEPEKTPELPKTVPFKLDADPVQAEND